MNLKDWIKEKGWSRVEFAKRAGVCRGTVYKWLNGKRPSKYSIKRLKELTDGQVKYEKISKTQVPRETTKN